MTLSKSAILCTLFAFCIGCAPAPIDVLHGSVRPAYQEFEPGETVRILTWNLEHFVDEYDDPYVDTRRENAPRAAANLHRRELLASALREIDADVVCLQEVESVAFMRSFVNESLPDLQYIHVAASESPSWYQNTVILSRLPLGVEYEYGSVVTPVEGFEDREGRPLTQNYVNTRMSAIEVLVNEHYEFLLCHVHLKAGTSERDHAFRTGQLNFLKGQFDRFLAERPDLNILIAGDLNSAPGYAEFDDLLSPWRRVDFDDPLVGSTVFTHSSKDPRRRIDHLLPNDGMMNEFVPRSARIASVENPAVLPEISDHLPLVAEFRVGRP